MEIPPWKMNAEQNQAEHDLLLQDSITHGHVEMGPRSKAEVGGIDGKRFAQLGAIAALLCAAAIFFNVISQSAAEPGASTYQPVRFEDSAGFAESADADVRTAVQAFINGMASGDAKTVWMYASEEDQAAFATEDAVYNAFAETFPAFAEAHSVSFEKSWQEGDTPFVELSLTDQVGNAYAATIGLWLDDAGDWKIVSLEVNAVTDQVALN